MLSLNAKFQQLFKKKKLFSKIFEQQTQKKNFTRLRATYDLSKLQRTYEIKYSLPGY
jgi:uncharacterized protein YaaR (DUF327 family)